MALTPEHVAFLDALQALVNKRLGPLPTKEAAAFRKQARAKLALVRTVLDAPKRGGRRAAPAVVVTPAMRIASIEEALEMTPRDLEEVWATAISTPDAATRREAEDMAFIRLIRGIEDHTKQEWFDACPLESVELDAMAAYNQIDVHGDDGGLLVQLHHRICINETKHDVNTYRRHIANQIDTLEFGIRWQSLGNTESRTGRSVEKDEFYKAVYLVQNPDASNLENNDEFREWKKTVIKPIVNGRNRLVDVYRKFGLLVLLDPFWTVKSLASNSRTPDFPSICKKILGDDQYYRHRKHDDDAVKAFFKAIGGGGLVRRLLRTEYEFNEDAEEVGDEDMSMDLGSQIPEGD